jgi:hypothetical protein
MWRPQHGFLTRILCFYILSTQRPDTQSEKLRRRGLTVEIHCIVAGVAFISRMIRDLFLCAFMLYLYGDERKTDGFLSVIFYAVSKESLSQITRIMSEFRFSNNLSPNFEFHYYDNTKHTNKLFSDFVLTLPIEFILHTEVPFHSEPASHILAFQYVVSDLVQQNANSEFRCFFDKLGGPKTETILRTEFGRFCRHAHVKIRKPLQFLDSKNSDFIQIADYLVAMKGKKEY